MTPWRRLKPAVCIGQGHQGITLAAPHRLAAMLADTESIIIAPRAQLLMRAESLEPMQHALPVVVRCEGQECAVNGIGADIVSRLHGAVAVLARDVNMLPSTLRLMCDGVGGCGMLERLTARDEHRIAVIPRHTRLAHALLNRQCNRIATLPNERHVRQRSIQRVNHVEWHVWRDGEHTIALPGHAI